MALMASISVKTKAKKNVLMGLLCCAKRQTAECISGVELVNTT